MKLKQFAVQTCPPSGQPAQAQPQPGATGQPHLLTMGVKDLLAEACARLAGVTKLTRDEMRLRLSGQHARDRRVHKRAMIEAGLGGGRAPRQGRRPG
jgi:hypothetical protein